MLFKTKKISFNVLFFNPIFVTLIIDADVIKKWTLKYVARNKKVNWSIIQNEFGAFAPKDNILLRKRLLIQKQLGLDPCLLSLFCVYFQEYFTLFEVSQQLFYTPCIYTFFYQGIKSYLREVSVHVLHTCKGERNEFIRRISKASMLDTKKVKRKIPCRTLLEPTFDSLCNRSGPACNSGSCTQRACGEDSF